MPVLHQDPSAPRNQNSSGDRSPDSLSSYKPTLSTTGLVEHYCETDYGIIIASVLANSNSKLLPSHAFIFIQLQSCSRLAPLLDYLHQSTRCGYLTNTPQKVPLTTLPPNDTSGEPGHVSPHALNQELPHCSSEQQNLGLATLLNKYAAIFSKRATDIALTNLVEHAIRIVPKARPIKRAPRRMGLEKEKEVERQVRDLVEKGMITPADSVWREFASVVSQSKKKDHGD